jgi:hypothetical protein
MLVKVSLAFALLPWAGYMTEAVLLSGYFVVSVGVIAWRGLREIDRAQAAFPLQGEPA